MKTCTVLPSTPALVTASTTACSVIECHGVPSASGGCTWLWHKQPPSHPARRVSTYWICTSPCNCQSRACGKLSTLLIHFGHSQSKSLIQHFPLFSHPTLSTVCCSVPPQKQLWGFALCSKWHTADSNALIQFFCSQMFQLHRTFVIQTLSSQETYLASLSILGFL